LSWPSSSKSSWSPFASVISSTRPPPATIFCASDKVGRLSPSRRTNSPGSRGAGVTQQIRPGESSRVSIEEMIDAADLAAPRMATLLVGFLAAARAHT